MFQTLAGILHLGNVAFAVDPSKEGQCIIVNKAGDLNTADLSEEKKCEDSGDALELAATMMGCDVNGLKKVLLSRRLMVGGEWYDVPLALDQAKDSRDALAKVCCASVQTDVTIHALNCLSCCSDKDRCVIH